jgi:hypothetical protein
MKALAQDLGLQDRTDDAEHCEERSKSRQHKQYSDPGLNHSRWSKDGGSTIAFHTLNFPSPFGKGHTW